MSGARITLLSQWLRFATQVIGYVALARLLMPSDFGLVAMVAPVVAFATLIADSGLSLAAVQANALSGEQKSGLFYLNAGASVVAAGIVVGSAPALASLYGEPDLVALTSVLALPLVLNGLAVQFRVELNRALRFGVLAAHDIVSAAAGLISAIVAAMIGAGYWALALQLIVQAAAALLLAVIQATWWPGRATGADLRSLTGFAGLSLALQISNLASRSVDVMAIGRVNGPADAGIYGRSTQLLTLVFQQFVTPLTRVVLPRLARASEAQFYQLLLAAQRAVSYCLLGAISLLLVLADPLLPLVLGDAWAAAATVTQVVAIGAAFQAIGYVYYWAFLARARLGYLLAAEAPGRIIMIVGAIILSGHGILAVAAAVAVGQALVFLGSSLVINRLGVDRKALITVAARPMCLFGLASIAGLSAGLWFGEAPWLALVMQLSGWSLIVAIFIASSRGVREDLRAVIEIGK